MEISFGVRFPLIQRCAVGGPAARAFVLALGLACSAQSTASGLLISEVLYDPPGSEPDAEWIELFNASGTTLDLTQYKVGDEEASGGSEGMWQFPSGTLVPGGVVVVANQATVFLATHGFLPAFELVDSDPLIPDLAKYLAWAGGSTSLSNSGDEVLVLDGDDAIADAVSWGNSTVAFDPAAPSTGAGASLARALADVDTDSASDWLVLEDPTPGQVAVSAAVVPLPPGVWLFATGCTMLARRIRRG